MLTQIGVVVGDYLYIDGGEVAIGNTPWSLSIKGPNYTPLPGKSQPIAVSDDTCFMNAVQWGCDQVGRLSFISKKSLSRQWDRCICSSEHQEWKEVNETSSNTNLFVM